MTTRILVLAALCVSMVSGCGASMARVQANDQMLTTPQAAANPHGAFAGARMFASLGLTDDQKSQLKAIMQKARTSAGAPDPAARQQFHALWTAATVDTAAFKTLLAARQAAAAQARDARVAALVEARNVLTADQRERVAAALEARGAKGGDGQHRPWQNGQHAPAVSAEAQAQLKAIAQKRHAGSNRMAAFAAFARTGDAEALKAAMAAADVTDDLVALAGSLGQDDRTKLERRAAMLAGFGGMRGPGMHGQRGQHARRSAAGA